MGTKPKVFIHASDVRSSSLSSVSLVALAALLALLSPSPLCGPLKETEDDVNKWPFKSNRLALNLNLALQNRS